MRKYFFTPMTMSDRDADLVMKLFYTLRDLGLVDDIAMLNVVGVYNFVQMQKQIMIAETDYDDLH